MTDAPKKPSRAEALRRKKDAKRERELAAAAKKPVDPKALAEYQRKHGMP
jgi:hypothetical protein